MSRLTTFGFKWSGYSAVTELHGESTIGGNQVVASTPPRTPPYCLYLPAITTVGREYAWPTHAGATGGFTAIIGSRYYSRVWIRPQQFAVGTYDTPASFTARNQTVEFCDIRCYGPGTPFQFFNTTAGTQVGVDGPDMVDGRWHCLELSWKIGPGATDEIYGRVDGVDIGSDTGLSLTDVLTGHHCRSFSGIRAASGVNQYWDDYALNVDTGIFQNSWCGNDTQIAMLQPISDNARVGWTAGDGSGIGLYSSLDNQANGVADPSTTGGQIKRAVANTTDTYDANLTSYLAAGIPEGSDIRLIHLVACIGQNSASPHSMGFKLVSNPATTEFNDTGPAAIADLYPLNWRWVSGGVEYNPSPTLATSPVMRIRKNTSHVTQYSFCCSMHAYVEYVPNQEPWLLKPRGQGAQQAIQRSAVW